MKPSRLEIDIQELIVDMPTFDGLAFADAVAGHLTTLSAELDDHDSLVGPGAIDEIDGGSVASGVDGEPSLFGIRVAELIHSTFHGTAPESTSANLDARTSP